MREILFKAKRIDNGQWVEGYYQQDEIDYKTLSEYTGLKDKHGNKIFENDVVLHTLANKEFSVIWGNGLGFRLNRISDNCNEFLLTQRFCDEYAEVIGNKFDNPELLTKE